MGSPVAACCVARRKLPTVGPVGGKRGPKRWREPIVRYNSDVPKGGASAWKDAAAGSTPPHVLADRLFDGIDNEPTDDPASPASLGSAGADGDDVLAAAETSSPTAASAGSDLSGSDSFSTIMMGEHDSFEVTSQDLTGPPTRAVAADDGPLGALDSQVDSAPAAATVSQGGSTMSADGADVSDGESSVSESSDSEHEVDTQDSLQPASLAGGGYVRRQGAIGSSIVIQAHWRRVLAQRAVQALRVATEADDQLTDNAAAAVAAAAPVLEKDAWAFVDELIERDGDGDIDMEHSCSATIERVPGRATDLWAECASFVARASTSDDERQRRRADAAVMLLPRLILTPVKDGGDWWTSKTQAAVRLRCKRFLLFEWRELYELSSQYAPTRPGEEAAIAPADARYQELLKAELLRGRLVADGSVRSKADLQKDAAVRLVQKGEISKSMGRLTSHGILSDPVTTGARLQAMQAPPMPTTMRAALERARAHRPGTPLVSEAGAKKAISKAATGKAFGPSGWRFEYCKAAAQSDDGLKAMVIIMQRIADGSFGVLSSSADRQSPIANGNLIPLKCDPEGKKIRPIVVGEALRRLTGSCLVRERVAAIEERCLKAGNLAFSTNGCATGFRTIELLLRANERWIVAETDLRSAFQYGHREKMLNELWNTPLFQDFIPFFLSLYDGDAKLFVDSLGTILSEWGCHQGCPLGTFLFVISIAPIVEKVMAAFPTVEVVGFADDYRFLGLPTEALDAAAFYKVETERDGHALQKAKGNVFSFSQESLDEVKQHEYCQLTPEELELWHSDVHGELEPPLAVNVCSATEGVEVFGAPLGDAAWCQKWLFEYLDDKIQPALEAVAGLGDHDKKGATQAAFLLLLYSASRKIGYLQRMVAPHIMHMVSIKYDQRVRACFSRIVNPQQELLKDLDDELVDQVGAIQRNIRANSPEFFGNEARRLAWRQATLPVRLGGMGLGCAELMSHAAFVAAWADFLIFMEGKPDLFPLVRSTISEQALQFSAGVAQPPVGTSVEPAPLLQLESSWQALERQLHRRKYGSLTEDIPGRIALCEAFGNGVTGISDLRNGKTKRQHVLSASMWDCYNINMRLGSDAEWLFMPFFGDDSYMQYEAMTKKDQVRFTSASGPEAAWVSQVPTRPEYRLNTTEWRTSIAFRLRIPIGFLRLGPSDCTCHRAFADNSRNIDHQRRAGGYSGRARNDPKKCDMWGDHDQCCKYAAPIIRHNKMQYSTLRDSMLKAKGCVSRIANVAGLRRNGSDPSQKKADIETDNLEADGCQTITDFGSVFPLVDTYINNKSRWMKGVAANKYGLRKSGNLRLDASTSELDKEKEKRLLARFKRDCLDPATGEHDPAREAKLRADGKPFLSKGGYLHTIAEKRLPIHYGGFITEAYGAFGKEAWDFTNKIAKRERVGGDPDRYNPWSRPEWKRHFILTIGFSIQRGNTAMFVLSDDRRRSQSKKFRASGPSSHHLG